MMYAGTMYGAYKVCANPTINNGYISQCYTMMQHNGAERFRAHTVAPAILYNASRLYILLDPHPTFG